MSGKNVKTLTDGDFDATISSNVPCLVDFWGPGCGLCKVINPLIDEMADVFAGRAVIAKMDVTEHSKAPGRIGIRALPTVIIFRDGKEFSRVSDPTSRHSLMTAIEQAIPPVPVVKKPSKFMGFLKEALAPESVVTFPMAKKKKKKQHSQEQANANQQAQKPGRWW